MNYTIIALRVLRLEASNKLSKPIFNAPLDSVGQNKTKWLNGSFPENSERGCDGRGRYSLGPTNENLFRA